MRRMSVREFGEVYGSGFEYVFCIDNQPQTSQLRRCASIISDRRVFDKVTIALNPDCMQFGNSLDEKFAIDCIDHINIRGGGAGLFFDIVCRDVYKDKFTFLMRKK